MAGELPRTVSRSHSSLRSLLSYLRDRPRLRTALIVGPPLFVLVVFFVIPLLTMLWLSFMTELPPGASFTLENYTRLVSQSVYLEVLWRTTVLTVQTTAIVGVIGYTLAYSIVRFSRRTTFLLLLVILPFWTNYIIRMYAWINILQKGGVLDYLLVVANVIESGNGYLYTSEAVLVGFVYIWLPLATLPFYASLTNMDPDLIDAAKDLGAGPIKTFFTVTLPTTKGGVIAGLILVGIPTFGSFITPVLLGGTNVIMVGVVIENQFNQAFNWPFGSALSMVVSAVVVALLVAGVGMGADLLAGAGGDD